MKKLWIVLTILVILSLNIGAIACSGVKATTDGSTSGQTDLAALQKATASSHAGSGAYAFNPELGYRLSGGDGNTEPIVRVTNTTPVSGIIKEVGCYSDHVLPGVSITIDGIGPVVSDQDGQYVIVATATGSHTLVAHKDGFRDRTQTINIAGLGQEFAVTCNFQCNYGFIPCAPDIWYALDIVNCWLYPPNPECAIDIWTALDVINAWLYPWCPTPAPTPTTTPTTTPSPTPTPTPTPTSTPVPLSVPTLLSPGNGTNVSATGIIFRWSAVNGATHYLIEINTDPNWGTGTRFCYLDWLNTSVAITGFPNNGTTYYWRVSAGNSYGWGSPSQGLSFVNGIGTPPAAPTLSTPGNGSSVAGPLITFQWNAPLGATQYLFEVNTDPGWGTGTRLYYAEVGTNSQTVTGFSNDGTTHYYWRVWASNAFGWSAASATWSLISRAADGAPVTPTLLSPADDSSEPGTSIAFHWSASSGATHYLFEINTDPNWTPGTRFGYCDIPNNFCSNPSLCYVIANNGLVVTPFPNDGTIYYWRVWAGNSNGWSAATSGQSLVNGISVPPATPTLSSPANGANVVGASINFRWSASSGATQYRLEVNTDPSFGTGTRFYYANVPSYSQTVTGFPRNGTTYYWRVWAGNSYGWSTATAGWSMVSIAGDVSPITTAPTLVSPDQNGVAMGFPVTFSWNPVDGATKYRLRATREDDSTVVDTDVGGVTSYTPPDLKYHFEPFIYHWMVWAGNDAGWCPDAAVLANERYFLHLYR